MIAVEEPAVSRKVQPWQAVLLLILLLAAGLRLYQLGTDSFWIDEISAIPRAHGEGILSSIVTRGPLEPPASSVVIQAATYLPLGREAAARLPSVLFGILEVVFCYELGRQLTGDRRVGLWAAGLLAVAPFAIRYSQEVRYYAMFSALHLASWTAFVRAQVRASRRAWALYGLLASLMVLTHIFGYLVILVQMLVVIAVHAMWTGKGSHVDRSKAVSGYLVGLAVLAAVVLPWLMFSLREWAGSLSSDGVKALTIGRPDRFAVRFNVRLLWSGASWLLGNSPRIGWLAGMAGGFVLLSPIVGKGLSRAVAAAIGMYLVALTAVIAYLARMGGTYFAYRRVEFFLPLLYVAGAIAFVGILDVVGRRGRSGHMLSLGVWAIAVGIVSLSLIAVGSYYDSEKTNYRAALEFASEVSATQPNVVVLGRFDPGWFDLVAFYGSWIGSPVNLQDAVHVDADRFRYPVTVVWMLGQDPDNSAFAWKPMNCTARLQIIGGDASWRDRVIPVGVAVSRARGASELGEQVEVVKNTRWFLDPPVEIGRGRC